MTFHWNKKIKTSATVGLAGLMLSSTSAFAVDKAPEKINDFFQAVFVEAVMDHRKH